MVRGAGSDGPVGGCRIGSRGDLLDPPEFALTLRHLRQGLSLDAGRCIRRLHTRVLRHDSLLDYDHGCLWHRFLLPAIHRELLVRSTLHLRGWSSFHMEFGIRLERHNRGWLQLWLSLLRI